MRAPTPTTDAGIGPDGVCRVGGLPWRWLEEEWRPDGWDPESERVALALAGLDATTVSAAVAGMEECANAGAEVASVSAWITWITQAGTVLPAAHPLPAGIAAFVRADPNLLQRAVNARRCPVALLRSGLDHERPEIRRAALAHDLLPHADREAHINPAAAEDLELLARSRTTPSGRLVELAADSMPAAVRLAALANPNLEPMEARRIIASLDAADQRRAADRDPRLFNLVLAATADAGVICAALLERMWFIEAQTTRRLLDLDEPAVDVLLAQRINVSRDQTAPALADRALAYLDGDREEAGALGPALVDAVLAYRLWHTSDQEGRLIGHLLERPDPSAHLTKLTVMRLSPANALRLLPHVKDPALRFHLVSTAVHVSEDLAAAAGADPYLASTVVQRDPFNVGLATSLIQAHPAQASGIVKAAAPRIRPALRHYAVLPRPACAPPDPGQSFKVGRYRYVPSRPGWVVAASGKPARYAAVLRRINSDPGCRFLTVLHDGLRLAAAGCVFTDPVLTQRLAEDIDLFEEAVRHHDRFLAADAADIYYQAVFDLRRSAESADVLLQTREILASIPEVDGERNGKTLQNLEVALENLHGRWRDGLRAA